MEEKKSIVFRILSLDGGGIRGLYTAVLLNELAKRIASSNHSPQDNLDLGKKFDLITGTSTGAILAVALAAGVSLEKIVDLYKNKAKDVFQRPFPINCASKLLWYIKCSFGAANRSEPLQQALEQIFGNETVEQLYQRRGIRLCIPTVNIETQRAVVYKTPHSTRLQRDNYLKLVDLCLSSAAAPIFFPVHKVETSQSDLGNIQYFVDGGLWANNPVLVGLTEALDLAPKDAKIEIISVSTCPPYKPKAIKNPNVSIFGWEGAARILDASIDAQSVGYDYIVKTLASHLGRVTYIRLTDPLISSELAPHLRLDNSSDKCINTLIKLACQAVDLNLSEATTGMKTKEPLINIFSQLKPLPMETYV
jgi:uncharacterized protein